MAQARLRQSSPSSFSRAAPNGVSSAPGASSSAVRSSNAAEMLASPARSPNLLSAADVTERGGPSPPAYELRETDDKETVKRRVAANGNGGGGGDAGASASEARPVRTTRTTSKDPRVHRQRRRDALLDKVLLSGKDRRSFLLLILLYTLQGVPIGLTFGTLPFLLKPKLSYSQLALLSLSTYPYSLKLLWSPIVDAWFSARVGRRKSWIVPVQGIMACAMFWLGGRINSWLSEDVPSVTFLTAIFVALIFFAATQDIAVDGWALTLLSHENLSYASTAQTIGLNMGYFMSFTVFLAFNSVEFGNKYFRSVPVDYPLITLGGYLRNWSFVYFAVTLWLLRFQHEDPVAEDEPDMDVKKVYKVMWNIVKLKHVQKFMLLHLVAKIGFMANDSVTSLKLIEKGFLKEDMAVAALIDFPFQILGGWLAASWSTGPRPLTPWMNGYVVRLLFGVLAMALVASFPQVTPIPYAYFLAVVAFTVLGSFTSTVQFVGISAFHTQISDPIIGGTYMTLLNTVSNLGGTWPKPLVLQGVDYFTDATCEVKNDVMDIVVRSAECVSDHGKAQCAALGGACVMHRDGYYVVSLLCGVLGALLLVFFIRPTVRRLQALPPSAWKVTIPQ